MKKYFLLAACMLFFATPVFAAGGPFANSLGKLNTAVSKTGLQSDLGASIGTIVQALLATVGTIFLILTIYAGILWMTAQGNEEKVGKAKQIVTAAVIGLVITVSAYAITAFVTGKLGNTSNNTNPNTPGCCASAGSASCYNVSNGTCNSGETFYPGVTCNDATGSCNAAGI